jgi:hypothetical protein
VGIAAKKKRCSVVAPPSTRNGKRQKYQRRGGEGETVRRCRCRYFFVLSSLRARSERSDDDGDELDDELDDDDDGDDDG